MTTQDIIDYYAKLLIIQYMIKPKAYAFMQAVIKPVVMDKLPDGVLNAFNIDTAVGVQLDTIGQYVGVTRSGNSIAGAPLTLVDADFRTLIKIAILKNNSGSSLATIQSLLNIYFPAEILVFDYQNMQMSYMINSSLGGQSLVQLVVTEGLLPKPMGVQLSSIVYHGDITHFFGFRTYALPGHNISPFNSYSSYVTTRPWLSYADAVS